MKWEDELPAGQARGSVKGVIGNSIFLMDIKKSRNSKCYILLKNLVSSFRFLYWKILLEVVSSGESVVRLLRAYAST